jgi:ATP-dependent protease HslVU (ClpYQ) peptidase subunit
MMRHASSLDARTIVEQSLTIASEICIYPNDRLTILELE